MTTVQNFRTRTKYHHLRDNGEVDLGPTIAEVNADRAEHLRPVGFGDIVTMICGRDRLGVAIYACGPELRLVIDGNQFDMLRSEFRAERVTVFPLVKRFTIWRDTEIRLSIRYLRTDALDDAHSGTRDIFRFIAEVMKSRDLRLRFYFVWQA